jgi:hypothetical protein
LGSKLTGFATGVPSGVGVYFLSQMFKAPGLYGQQAFQLSPTGQACCGGVAPCSGGAAPPGGPVYMGTDNLVYIGAGAVIGVVGVLLHKPTLAGWGAGMAVGYLGGKLTEILGSQGICFGGRA